MVVGQTVAHWLGETEATAVEWEEPNWLATFADDRHLDVIVSAGSGCSEFWMEVGTHQLWIAAAKLVPTFAMLGGQLGSCKHCDVHLSNA
jgi:hypothetical protein